jgi:ABC-type uncharacterized transport system substrate-binding protein
MPLVPAPLAVFRREASKLDQPGLLRMIEMLHQVLPSARRIAYLSNPTNAGTPPTLQSAADAAQRLGLELVVVDVVARQVASHSQQHIATITSTLSATSSRASPGRRSNTPPA